MFRDDVLFAISIVRMFRFMQCAQVDHRPAGTPRLRR